MTALNSHPIAILSTEGRRKETNQTNKIQSILGDIPSLSALELYIYSIRATNQLLPLVFDSKDILVVKLLLLLTYVKCIVLKLKLVYYEQELKLLQ